jgi:hypothetical protein
LARQFRFESDEFAFDSKKLNRLVRQFRFELGKFFFVTMKLGEFFFETNVLFLKGLKP